MSAKRRARPSADRLTELLGMETIVGENWDDPTLNHVACYYMRTLLGVEGQSNHLVGN